MYSFLSGPLIEYVVQEIRGFWSTFPFYEDMVENIQGSHSHEMRGQKSILVKYGGGSNVKLTWDNFQGHVDSYVYRAGVDYCPSKSIEWVREDAMAIRANEGVFPSPAGVYIVEIIDSELDAKGRPTGHHKFQVTSTLRQYDEGVQIIDPTTALLRNIPVQDSLKLYEVPSNYQLRPGIDYVLDVETGEVLLTNPVLEGTSLSADYLYAGDVSPLYDIQSERAHYKAIPGAVLAFGRNIVPEDKVAIVVSDIREIVAQEYGGRWKVNLEIEVRCRDLHELRYMMNRMQEWIPVELRPRLSARGVELEEIDAGGEEEEDYDENANDPFYQSNISLSMETDWLSHKPLTGYIRDISMVSLSDLRALETSDPIAYASLERRIQITQRLGLRNLRDPFFSKLGKTFSMVR